MEEQNKGNPTSDSLGLSVWVSLFGGDEVGNVYINHDNNA